MRRRRNPAQMVEILLVEDSRSDQLITRAALDEAKLINRLHIVTDGEQALAFLRQEEPYEEAPRPELVLLDLNLPRLSGREVLERMKADPDLRGIPVIVLTTSGTPEDIHAAYSAHANSYIQKPVDFAEFHAAVKALRDYWFQVVTLPAEIDAIQPVQGPNVPRPAPSQRRPPAQHRRTDPDAPPHVLLVEDSPTDRFLATDALINGFGSEGVRITAVDRLSTAMEAAANTRDPIDAVLCDLDLPDARGLEVVHELRALDPALPILVLTGTFAKDRGRRAVRHGADDYLVKAHLSPRSVQRAVSFALERRQTMTRLARTQQLEMIGRLAASVAHDFNNLLMVVRGTAASLRHDPNTDDIAAKS